MKPIKEKKEVSRYRLQSINIKEIINKYPDKVVDVYNEGKHAVLQLSNMKIKFLNKRSN
tara:strand:- start:252 stop:428 length:177 start_codon:yes stop_codon:yes gene_type:complete